MGACSSFSKTLKSDLITTFEDSFVGFALFDPETNEYLLEHQADKYFTPASNTKLLTFYLANAILEDSVVAFKYELKGDSIWIWGTGDPSFLHPDLPESPVLNFLKGKHIILVGEQYPEPKYGSGWAWDDFDGSYQREKSSFPIYGNALRLDWDSTKNVLQVLPEFYKDYVTTFYGTPGPSRALNQNLFYYYHPTPEAIDIPIQVLPEETAQLLLLATGSSVSWVAYQPPINAQNYYSIPLDSLLRPMLQQSDNFIAEQLILLCSNKLFDNSNSLATIKLLTDSLLGDLPQKPIWVDGSGLSRYNMITPRSLVTLLSKTANEVERQRLLALLPAGGQSGTLESNYISDKPYIFAKTGSLRHNHALSGYLIAKSGKMLIFSFMHNHFPTESAPIKKHMERLLWQIHLNY